MGNGPSHGKGVPDHGMSVMEFHGGHGISGLGSDDPEPRNLKIKVEDAENADELMQKS